jgi:hypothetical protein
VLYNSDAGFVATVKSCRIRLKGVQSGFFDFKNTSLLRVKEIRDFEQKFLDDDLGNFSTTSFQPFHFSCKMYY